MDPSGGETKTPDHERRIVADTNGPSMTTLWIGTSWKMNKTLAEARAWAQGLRDHLGDAAPAGVQPFVIPSFTATTAVAGVLGTDSPVLLGVQNAHWEDAGAWTGEVSVPQAKDAEIGRAHV